MAPENISKPINVGNCGTSYKLCQKAPFKRWLETCIMAVKLLAGCPS